MGGGARPAMGHRRCCGAQGRLRGLGEVARTVRATAAALGLGANPRPGGKRVGGAGGGGEYRLGGDMHWEEEKEE